MKNLHLRLALMLLTLVLLSGCAAKPTGHAEPQVGNTRPPAETDDVGVQDDIMIAYGLLLEADEVKYYTELGMSVQYTGQIEVIDCRPCWVFALGTEHGEQFVRERYYAVCDNIIYFYDAGEDAWNVLGAG